ncbi:hypothetical protein PV08_11377 [Exophiala spinifera]|uniref:Uncharacterized protein n=1 Tax=Exophiala spinifera TaxID=91928 RepID=A0A0D2BGD2_9EURO|nr:uncharacterized protein PV08_11377 [Exophiala spinifera]KIW10414.1 hypothetical protein PV08_11377 [Exophiala spinifera]
MGAAPDQGHTKKSTEKPEWNGSNGNSSQLLPYDSTSIVNLINTQSLFILTTSLLQQQWRWYPGPRIRVLPARTLLPRGSTQSNPGDVLADLGTPFRGSHGPEEDRDAVSEPLPSFKAGRIVCVDLEAALDLVTSRTCYSKPGRLDRTACGMFDKYDKQIEEKRKDGRDVRRICERETDSHEGAPE